MGNLSNQYFIQVSCIQIQHKLTQIKHIKHGIKVAKKKSLPFIAIHSSWEEKVNHINKI